MSVFPFFLLHTTYIFLEIFYEIKYIKNMFLHISHYLVTDCVRGLMSMFQINLIQMGFFLRWVKGEVKRGLPPHRKDLLNTVQQMMRDLKKENPFVDDRPGRKWFEVESTFLCFKVRN